MNSAKTTSPRLNLSWIDAHSARTSALLTLFVAALVAPFSFWGYGWAGVSVVALGASVIVASAALAQRIGLGERSNAGFLFATVIRLMAPLALVLAIVIMGREYVAPASVLYIVPLYLVMLAADTWCLVRQINRESSGSHGSARAKLGDLR